MASTTTEVLSPAIARGRFDEFTILVHWISASLVVAMFAKALAIHGGVLFSAGAWLFAHRSIGVALWVLTVTRMLWRVGFARFPEFPAGMSALWRRIVVASECLLYALLLEQPLTGLLMTLLRGKPFAVLWWQVPALLPKYL